jgi:cytochrome c6
MTETKTPKALILLVIVAALVGTVVVAGCGGGGSSGSTESMTSEETAPAAGGGTAEKEGANEEEPSEGKETGGAEAGEGTEKVPGESAGIEADEAGAGGAALSEGKTVFTTNCSTCHTLKAADATGEVGPNLDELEPDMATVEKQVENGGGGMPAFKGQLSAEEIKDVATFVSSEAGK